MPLQIVRNDITKMHVDAIVNAANESLLGGGGVDGSIHRAAGPELLSECRTLGGCRTGDAKITGGYQLPCKYVIHTVGPVWDGGHYGERELLVSCYQRSLELALEHDCESVAFSLISSGVYGYPKDQALRVAVDTISAFLVEHEMTVYIVIYDRTAYQISSQLFADVAAYIDDVYVDAHSDVNSYGERRRREAIRRRRLGRNMKYAGTFGMDNAPAESLDAAPALALPSENAARTDEVDEALYQAFSLDDALNQLEEGFSETLLHLIDASGMTDAQCYKKANIDRKLFHKIRTNKFYKPSKPTVLAFALALELSLPETRELLAKAGYAFSNASKFDVIVRYCMEHGMYNVYKVNEVLFAFDQSLIGA